MWQWAIVVVLNLLCLSQNHVFTMNSVQHGCGKWGSEGCEKGSSDENTPVGGWDLAPGPLAPCQSTGRNVPSTVSDEGKSARLSADSASLPKAILRRVVLNKTRSFLLPSRCLELVPSVSSLVVLPDPVLYRAALCSFWQVIFNCAYVTSSSWLLLY